MDGDFHQGEGKDEEKRPREFWTSVSRKAGGKFIQNENIKLVFNSDAAARACRVVVRNASTAPITVQPEFPQTQVTLLTINGKPTGTHGPADAVVEIWDTANKSLLNVLMVKVLPERKIPFRIWYMKDVVPANQTIAIPDDAKSAFGGVEQTLKDAFHQACIDFEQTHSPNEIEINYDSDGDGALDVNKPQGGDDVEFTNMLNSTQFTAKLNIVVARKLIYYPPANVQGVGPPRANKVFVFTDAFTAPGGPPTYNRIPWVCAHEVGRARELSTRNANLNTVERNHESGRFPGDPYRQPYDLPGEGLMKQWPKKDQIWLRHEDWIEANVSAGRLLHSALVSGGGAGGGNLGELTGIQLGAHRARPELERKAGTGASVVEGERAVLSREELQGGTARP